MEAALYTFKQWVKDQKRIYPVALHIYKCLIGSRRFVKGICVRILFNDLWPVWVTQYWVLLFDRIWKYEIDFSRISFHYYCIGDEAFREAKLKKALTLWNQSLYYRQQFLKQTAKHNIPSGTIITSGLWTRNIGHLALLVYLIKLQILGWLPEGPLRLYVDPSEIANNFYLTKYLPFINLVTMPSDPEERRHIETAQTGFNIINTSHGPQFLYNYCAFADKEWGKEQRPPLISLSDAEGKAAYENLANLGLKTDSWFVTFHARGPNYRKHEAETTRNTPLSIFDLAMQAILEAGGQVVVLGEPGVEIPASVRGRVIDYANSAIRSPELDIFLCAACRFFVGTVTGITYVPPTFAVPTLFTNVTPMLSRPWSDRDSWIPKLIWSKNKKRYLTLKEMMDIPTCLYDTHALHEQNNLQIKDNTPEDILDAVVDMMNRLNGKIVEDTELQGYVRSLDPHNLTQPNFSSISPRFAKRRSTELGLESFTRFDVSAI